MITFNQELAQNSDATGGNYNSQVDVFKIKEAKWVDPKAGSEARAIEFTAVNKAEQEFRYMTVYYTKRDGSQNDGGMKMINAMMGLLGIQQLTNVNGAAPEFAGKFLKLALERVNYTKGNGDDGFKFDMKLAFDYQSGQTYPEKQAGKEPESIAYWTKRFEENPNGVQEKGRNAPSPQGGQQYGAQAPQQGAASNMDDEIPW